MNQPVQGSYALQRSGKMGSTIDSMTSWTDGLYPGSS
jgi:hypothetical protein